MLQDQPPQPPALQPPVGLSLETLTVPKEKTYFGFVLVASIVIWLVIAVTIVGAFYALLFGFLLWLGNGLLTAYLRAEAVRIDEHQLPELHATFKQVCERLRLYKTPALYVLQSGGLLNAFATRFAGRDFVVVYSEFLEALGPSSPEMRFILGHEVGHIQSRHILKQIFLAPGLFWPLIGPAYRRAWETSCDRYGAFAADDVGAATRAMLVLSGGRGHGPSLNPAAFAGQNSDERGFFVSLHELSSTYPTLSRRVTDLMALKDGAPAKRPPRNPLAYLLATFIPGGTVSSGGPVGALMFVVLIGLLAAMAIPAFQKVRQASEAKVCINNQRMLAAALDQYRLENGHGASKWDDVVGADKYVKTMPSCPNHGTYNATYDAASESYKVTCTIPGHDPAAFAAGTGRH